MASLNPTDSELEILQVLWRRGPSTVRDVMEELADDRDRVYTTVLKLLQIMHGKGLVERDDSSRTHVYAPAVGRRTTERAMLADLADRAFEGSAVRLAMRALSTKRASPEELAEVRRLLEELEGEG
ncbi:MAG TPA: BlaI/MecI/CopY family transcriptional regulator [Longimicrobiales bacterium]|nr:BlaI/MecI/CopY family transcriptional regulator [Longimicrobiales bacterium]